MSGNGSFLPFWNDADSHPSRMVSQQEDQVEKHKMSQVCQTNEKARTIFAQVLMSFGHGLTKVIFNDHFKLPSFSFSILSHGTSMSPKQTLATAPCDLRTKLRAGGTSFSTRRAQNPDIPRAGRVGAPGGTAGRGRTGLGANRTVRPGDEGPSYPPRHRRHVA